MTEKHLDALEETVTDKLKALGTELKAGPSDISFLIGANSYRDARLYHHLGIICKEYDYKKYRKALDYFRTCFREYYMDNGPDYPSPEQVHRWIDECEKYLSSI